MYICNYDSGACLLPVLLKGKRRISGASCLQMRKVEVATLQVNNSLLHAKVLNLHAFYLGLKIYGTSLCIVHDSSMISLCFLGKWPFTSVMEYCLSNIWSLATNYSLKFECLIAQLVRELCLINMKA